MIERPRRVVLLIDYDNLQICAARDTPGRELQLPPVVQLAQRFGTVVVARAYAEWNLSTERLAVYKAGIEPAFAPVLRTESDRSGKSLADTVMVAEGMDMLWTLSPEVVVLATSDKDLIPLVRVAKQRGAFVVVLGSDFTAIPLREMADEHVTYRQLITDPAGRLLPEPGSGRQPAALPEASRRRSRESSGRERTVATAAAPASPPIAVPGRTERPAERPDRPEPRPEREVGPVSSPVPATAAASTGAGVVSGEPLAVAPVSTSVGDTESQIGGRRRRRRGSRRRSERLGVGTESYTSGDPSAGEAAPAPNDVEEPDTTPISSVIDAVEASGENVEAVEPITTNGSTPEAAVIPPPNDATPIIRERRRRTRRPTGSSTAEPSAAADADTPTSAVDPQSVGDQPAAAASPEPLEAVASSEDSSTSQSENGNGTAADEPASTPRPRTRRVASAARGRSRAPR